MLITKDINLEWLVITELNLNLAHLDIAQWSPDQSHTKKLYKYYMKSLSAYLL